MRLAPYVLYTDNETFCDDRALTQVVLLIQECLICCAPPPTPTVHVAWLGHHIDVGQN